MNDNTAKVISERKGSLLLNDYDAAKKGYVIKTILLNAALFASFSLYVAIFLAADPEALPKKLMICTAVYIMIAAAANIMVWKIVQKNSNVYLIQLAALSDSDYWALCGQVVEKELMYSTFYMLDDYIYFPSRMLLLPYKDIYRLFIVFKTRRITAIGPEMVEGAQLRIMLQNEKTIKVTIGSISGAQRLHKEYNIFIKLFDEKKETFAEVLL